jgi:hypothetical protein
MRHIRRFMAPFCGHSLCSSQILFVILISESIKLITASFRVMTLEEGFGPFPDCKSRALLCDNYYFWLRFIEAAIKLIEMFQSHTIEKARNGGRSHRSFWVQLLRFSLQTPLVDCPWSSQLRFIPTNWA